MFPFHVVAAKLQNYFPNIFVSGPGGIQGVDRMHYSCVKIGELAGYNTASAHTEDTVESSTCTEDNSIKNAQGVAFNVDYSLINDGMYKYHD